MRTKNFFKTLILSLLPALTLGACGLVFDDEEDCKEVEPTVYKVRFRYDMNMKFADAFAHEVHAVTLLALDDDDHIVWKGSESGDALAQEGYTMTVPVDPGTYKLLAWCTTNSQDTYNIDVSGRSTDRYSCTMVIDDHRGEEIRKDVDYIMRHDLDDLYHGLETDVDFPDEPGEHIFTVPLTKDTNRFNVVLQHLSGDPIQEGQFSFEITASNLMLDYQNQIVPGYYVDYEPWEEMTASADLNGNYFTGEEAQEAAVEGGSVFNVVVAELTTNRLVKGDDNLRLIVTNNETEEEVFNIPVIDYVLMVKGFEHADMDDQEYLDRQDQYSMTFFLDERDQWFSAFIYINAWRIVLNKSTL